MRRLLCCVLLAFSGAVCAAPFDGASPPASERTAVPWFAERFVTPAEAAVIARRETGGRVLAVHLVGAGPGAHYRVRLLVDGQIRIVRVDAHDGRLLR